MALNETRILECVRAIPPRCLQRFNVKKVTILEDDDWYLDVSAAWELACKCGSATGTVLGHPLKDLKPNDDGSNLYVSPFGFQCGQCCEETEILDTGKDGTGAELAKRTGSGVGCAAYRGKGRGSKYVCQACGESQGSVSVALYFNTDYMYELEENETKFECQDLFSGVLMYFRCAGCKHKSVVTELDTKY